MSEDLEKSESSPESTRFVDKHGAAIGVVFGVGLLVLLSVFQSC